MVCYNLYVQYEGPGSLVKMSSSREPSRRSRRSRPPDRDEETRLRHTNRSGPAYAIFGPLAAMIRCRMREFRA